MPESSTQNLTKSFTTSLSISSHSTYNACPTRSNIRPVSPTSSSPLLASSSNSGQRSGGQRGVNCFVPYSMRESHSAQSSQTHLDVPSHPHPRRTQSDQELLDGLLAESQEYQQSQRTGMIYRLFFPIPLVVDQVAHALTPVSCS